jgi:ribosomal protein S18 acetylase RimI-like enzyme
MAITVHLPDAPAIAGLSFRPIRGEEDADALYAVHVGRMVHDEVDPLSTFEDFPSREHLHVSLSKAVAGSRQDHWLVAQIGERVVGYRHIACWPEGDGTWVYLTLGWVLPEWRGKGIGTAMLHWTKDRIRCLAAAQHPNEKIEFAANASSTEREATALLLHEGYRAGYTMLEMGLDASVPVPAYTLPAGIDVRPVLPDHYSLIAASVREAYQHEYDAGRFDEGFDPAAYVTELSNPKHDPTLWQVAWDGNQIAGQVLSLIENGRAEVFEVSVRPAWRRRGLARGLLSRALHSLRARGIDVIRLHTRADSRTRASDLYHSVGFRVLKEFPRYRKSFNLQHKSMT